ncbi:MAG: helix-turn-helix transcriptional regulator, partial [Clostridia bacterium]|nr:helix-turn-helix transcriptional regulator [Clostridia bacterium]
AVSKWEREISCPDITLLPDIARVLGVSIAYLLGAE